MRPPRLRNRQSEKKKKTGWSSVTIFSADTGGAILPFGGNFSAVGGFLVFGGSGTPKYGGIFSAVMQYGGKFFGGRRFFIFGGNDFGESGKPKYGGIFSAVMHYGGNFLAVMQYGGNFWR